MSELETFVLSYLEDAGGLVEPLADGVHEVLMPDAIAERWGVPAHQRVAFAESHQPDVTRLSYNHPWVERLVAEAQGQPATTRLYINRLRLDKSELAELAAGQWVVLNGRVTPQKRATTARVRSTYVRFNFKAAILSDEKQEQLVSVLMDAQNGYHTVAAETIETRATAVEPDEVLRSLTDAPMQWQRSEASAPETMPLALPTLQGLLARAQTAVQLMLQDQLTALRKRIARFRELDEARLNEYFDGLQRDLEHRLNHAMPERRASLEDKLAAVQQERAHKLADVAARYQVRVQLTLLNLLVIQQAKLVVPVVVSNRATEVTVFAVWDPLMHRLEPLPCSVCGQPLSRLALCHNGHLAHEECLAPACVDCKRLFCRLCRNEVGECIVCHRPLCRHSRITCPDCKRGTCQAHRGLCHADQGEPVDLTRQGAPSEPPPPPPPPPAVVPKLAVQPPKPKPVKPQAQSKSAPSIPTKGPKIVEINVLLDMESTVAYAMAARGRQVAQREWTLVVAKGGIVRHCECEKGVACRAHGIILRPMEATPIEHLMRTELEALAAEYGFPVGKLKYYRASPLSGQLYEVQKFAVIGAWKDEAVLKSARETFDRLYRR